MPGASFIRSEKKCYRTQHWGVPKGKKKVIGVKKKKNSNQMQIEEAFKWWKRQIIMPEGLQELSKARGEPLYLVSIFKWFT